MSAVVVGRKRCLDEGTFAVSKRSRCFFSSSHDGVHGSSQSQLMGQSGPPNDHCIPEFANSVLGENSLHCDSSPTSYAASVCGQYEPFGAHSGLSIAHNGLEEGIEGPKKSRMRRLTCDVSDTGCPELDIDAWARRFSESLQQCTVWDDVQSRLKPQLQSFLKEIVDRGCTSKSDEAYVREVGGDPSSDATYRSLYETTQQKMSQMTTTQQILSRKILTQHEKIQSLISNERIKDDQLEAVSSLLAEARDQIRRLRESNQALQYYLSNQQTFPEDGPHNIIHRRGPDVF